jgi:predicted dehydrogenase/threonine dehydrogenase-like Zn-dependent dehydrogenase
MKQILLRGGKAIVEDVPAPQLEFGQVLVQAAWSCVSSGTELASAAATSTVGVVDRFRRNPELLRKAYKIFQDRGLRNLRTIAQDRLSYATVSGYSCAGTVLEVSVGTEGFAPGDRVACAGSGYANHAEFVVVPQNLVVKVPDEVDLADASTVALGAIALQGIRRAQATLGERIGVIGLGFVGQITAQLLKVAGCKVFGTDLDTGRVAQAKELGIDMTLSGTDLVGAARQFSEGYGLDAVMLTAATESDEPLELAMQMARRKGRIVVVGDVGLGIRRKAMYTKELDLLISTSYGPGRYDTSYEEDGLDYPYPYVRWTENRNMQAYLELIAARQVVLGPLTSYRLPFLEACEAYRLLREGTPRPYTVLLQYATQTNTYVSRHVVIKNTRAVQTGTIRLGILGAGAFARSVHIPNLQQLTERFHIEAVITRHGPTALSVARKVGARIAGTDYREVLADPAVDAVMIATRHYLHATMVEEALRAGKHVFVEKPLAVTEEELNTLEKLIDELSMSRVGCPVVFVGFNRRYSPYIVRMRDAFAVRIAPLQIVYRMNAGYLPPEHWVHGLEGGGRVLGEACHIFDLFRFLIGAPALEIRARGVRSSLRDVSPIDNFTATICYTDGSICTLLYTAQGGQGLPKEAIEFHGNRQSFILDDYRQLRSFGTKMNVRTKRQEKGHYEELLAYYQAITGVLDWRSLWDEAVEVTRTTIEVDRQVRSE